MSHRRLLSLAFIFAAFTLPALAVAPGAAAPDFKGTDSNGAQHTLSEYRGKYVVLEWANQGCPYDRKHYLSGSIESQQREWTAKGVVWLSVISSAPGEQGYVTPSEENTYLKTMRAAPTAALLDPTSAIARLYEAKTTPHIFVIDPTGKLIYQGAIDDKPTTEQADLKGALNFLNEALTSPMAANPAPAATTTRRPTSIPYPPLHIMRVLIVLAVIPLLHRLRRSVPQMQRPRLRSSSLNIRQHRPISRINRIRLRSQRQINHSLHQRQFPLRMPQKVHRILRAQTKIQRLRSRQPNILDRHPHNPSRTVHRVLARFEHPPQPIHRRIWIRVPHTLMQRRNNVIVLLALL